MNDARTRARALRRMNVRYRPACAGFIRLPADENAALERADRAPLGLMRTALGELEAAF